MCDGKRGFSTSTGNRCWGLNKPFETWTSSKVTVLNLGKTYKNYIHVQNAGNNLSMLIDTGAHISILKRRCISSSYIDYDDYLEIKGVTPGSIWSLGTCTLNLMINGHRYAHTFHIVNDKFPIDSNGILGYDFITKFKCNINYNLMQIVLRNPNEISVPLVSSKTQSVHKSIYVVPARCKYMLKLTDAVLNEDVVIHRDELMKGVFVPHTIVSKNNPVCPILNTNDHEIEIEFGHLKYTPVKNYRILSLGTVNVDRNEKVLRLLQASLPRYAPKELMELLSAFADVFALKEEPLTVNNFYEQEIRLRDDEPVVRRNYRTPFVHKDIIKDKVDQMLKDRIVEPSASPYNSPVLLVPKKSNTDSKDWRLVVDFREINKKVIPDRFPLPRVEDILDQLGCARYFSVVDLYSGFHQIPLKKESRDVTSFSVEQGSYRFTRVPFGLNISPNSFSRMMSIAFAGIPTRESFLYMDDIIVIGRSELDHLKNLSNVFATCRKYNLKLNPAKCKFFQESVTFLGHKCTKDGILPDEGKFAAITNYPVPSSSDEVRRFVAFANYYRKFIKNFAEIALPLNKLTKRKELNDFVWTDECQQAFDKLKTSLIKPPILQYPDFSKEFVITCDASDVACGFVLSQDHNGVDLPISFASRSFTKGEKNKPTIEKELLAIYFAIQYYRPYLFGRKFIVKSDHRPLVHLFTMKDPSSRLTRIRLSLEEYNFEVQYIPGKENVAADALSRIDIEMLKELRLKAVHVLVTTRAQSKRNINDNDHTITKQPNKVMFDPVLPPIHETLNNFEYRQVPRIIFSDCSRQFNCSIIFKGKLIESINLIRFKNGREIDCPSIFRLIDNLCKRHEIETVVISKGDCLFNYIGVSSLIKSVEHVLRNIKIVIIQEIITITDDAEKSKWMQVFHDDPLYGGHSGQSRTIAKIKSYFYWKNMDKDIKTFVKTCHKCQLNKSTPIRKPLSTMTPTPTEPFDTILMDLIGPFPITEAGNTFALTVQCDLTKYLIVVPIKNKEALTVARAFFENIFMVYGPVRHVRTDNGREFVNRIFSGLTQIVGTNHVTSAPYHPQSIGPLERNHRVVNSYLKMYINDKSSDWDLFLRFYVFHWNTTPLPLLGSYTPFELVYNRKPNIPGTLIGSPQMYSSIDDYVKEVEFRFKLSHFNANKWLTKLKEIQKVKLDAKARNISFNINDRVKILDAARKKLDPFFKGPMLIVGLELPNVIVKDMSSEVTYKVNVDRVKLYHNRN